MVLSKMTTDKILKPSVNKKSQTNVQNGKVLIACEFSGIVREAFRRKGINAWSCDLEPSEIPSKYHIQDDVLNHLNDGWDMMIAHPPCTFLCRNRARLNKIQDVAAELKQAKDFFMKFYNAPIEKICIENPVPAKSLELPRYSQIIQPYYFGHDHSKKTCLWLKNLPLLQQTNRIEISYIYTPNGVRYTKGWYEMPRTTKARSRTFTGIADAMANQWSEVILV